MKRHQYKLHFNMAYIDAEVRYSHDFQGRQSAPGAWQRPLQSVLIQVPGVQHLLFLPCAGLISLLTIPVSPVRSEASSI